MNQEQIFSIFDLLSLLLWLMILFGFARMLKFRFNNEEISRYFYFGWGFKIFFALVFTLVYLFVLGGGDVNAYWDSATVLNNLFLENPFDYLSELSKTNRELGITHHFNAHTGYPPGWIWRETEAWNAAKVLSIFSIITFNSFWASTVLIASLVFFVSWLLVYRISTHEMFKVKAVVIAFLFFPSVTFWCSGFSKDSIVYLLSIILIHQLFLRLKWSNDFSILRIVYIVFVFLLLFNLRHFIALAVLIPFFLAISVRFGNRWNKRPVILYLFRLLTYGVMIIGFIVISGAEQTQELINEAQITQSDFSQNPIYTGARYDMPYIDGTPVGLLRSMPLSVFIALYRPFITENIGVNFIMNGLESVVLIILSLFFLINKNLFNNVRHLFKSEFAIYALTFILLIAFMAGYTSILFGVLVRIRAIALPFFLLLLTFRKPKPTSTP